MKTFHVSDVLSITTGRLLSTRHIEGVYDILNFMTGDEIYTHQIPRAMKDCLPYLEDQFPKLCSPYIDQAVRRLDTLLKDDQPLSVWLSGLLAGQYGVTVQEFYDVEAIPEDKYRPHDPYAELAAMGSPDQQVIPTYLRLVQATEEERKEAMSRREEVDEQIKSILCCAENFRIESNALQHQCRTLADEVDTLRAEKSRIASDFFEASAQRASRDAVITKLLDLYRPGSAPENCNKDWDTYVSEYREWEVDCELYRLACEIAGRKK